MSNAIDKRERFELIDGVIYDMSPSAHPLHSDVNGNIYTFLRNALKDSLCKVYIENFDVYLNKEEAMKLGEHVIPDIVILCDFKKNNTDFRYYGIPRFVVETISPSTAKKDLTVKMNFYAKKGVEEYWIVDYKSCRVDVYYLENSGFVLNDSCGIDYIQEERRYNYDLSITLRGYKDITITLGDIFRDVHMPEFEIGEESKNK